MEFLDDWHASEDHQPVGPPRLNVWGTCQFNELGWSAELRRTEPQGINPRILMLDLVVTAPEPIRAPKIEDIAVTPYEQEVLPGQATQYDQVQIQVVGLEMPGLMLDVKRVESPEAGDE